MSKEKSHDGRDGWEEDADDTHKPKRLDEAVVSYLVDLEAQMNNMAYEDAETKAIFVENVLTEIKQSTASAACGSPGRRLAPSPGQAPRPDQPCPPPARNAQGSAGGPSALHSGRRTCQGPCQTQRWPPLWGSCPS